MSVLVPIISDIVLSIDSIDTIVESFQKGYLDHVSAIWLAYMIGWWSRFYYRWV